MTFSVKELFYSIQGEGVNAGKPAVFCRFSGCNMWSGIEKDRADSVCRFCDTDFIDGVKHSEAQLIGRISELMRSCHFLIFTGGEPALQLTASLINAITSLHNATIAIETNGSMALPAGIDWITVSPKRPDFIVRSGNEMKLLFPHRFISPRDVEYMEFDNFCLQPIHDENYKENLADAIDYCMAYPQWRLSLQQHKVLGVR